MVFLPAFSSTSSEIVFKHYEKGVEDWRRPHLGASKIGTECERELWYSFRWCAAPEFGRGEAFERPGQMLRLLERGQREEIWLAEDLIAAGVKLDVVDGKTGKQFGKLILGGHFGGSFDGIGTGWPEGEGQAIYECKTHKAASWRALKKHGLEKNKPRHYAQCQTYMRISKIHRTMYFAVNKDTDQILVIRVRYDPAYAKSIEDKARRVIYAERPPRRVKDDPKFWQCNLCDARKLCHTPEEAPQQVHCRTCVYSFPAKKGAGDWGCRKHSCDLTLEEQKAGCEERAPIPGLESHDLTQEFQ